MVLLKCCHVLCSRRPASHVGSRPGSASSQASVSEPNSSRSSVSARSRSEASYDTPDSQQVDSDRSVASVSKVDVGGGGEPERYVSNHRSVSCVVLDHKLFLKHAKCYCLIINK